MIRVKWENLLGQIGDHLEVVHDLRACLGATFDTKAQHTPATQRQFFQDN